jgi:hypothetical protein
MYKMTLQVWLKSVFTYNFNFVAYVGYRNITFYISAVFEVSSADAKHSLCFVCFWILNSNLLAPHTSGPRDVPRCGALSLLQKDAALQGDPAETAVG